MFYWSPELWNQAVDLAAAYWIVPVGLVALAFYGSYHFNTPDYALAAERAGSEDLPWNAPTSKLRGLAPPLFTTSRTQYRRYELRYRRKVVEFDTDALFFRHVPLRARGDLRERVAARSHERGAEGPRVPGHRHPNPSVGPERCANPGISRSRSDATTSPSGTVSDIRLWAALAYERALYGFSPASESRWPISTSNFATAGASRRAILEPTRGLTPAQRRKVSCRLDGRLLRQHCTPAVDDLVQKEHAVRSPLSRNPAARQNAGPVLIEGAMDLDHLVPDKGALLARNQFL